MKAAWEFTTIARRESSRGARRRAPHWATAAAGACLALPGLAACTARAADPLPAPAPAAVPARSQPATVPVAGPGNGLTAQQWQERQDELNRRVAAAGPAAQLIFIGDSITQGWEAAGRAVWEQHYASEGALNLGIGGDYTQHVLWRLDHGNLEGLQPRVAVLLIGTNNVTDDPASVRATAAGVSAVVQSLRARLPGTRVLLLAILPRGSAPNPGRAHIAAVNDIIRGLADGRRVFWLDFGARFVAADGSIPAQLMADALHPTARGYELWAQAMDAPLTRLLREP